MMSRIGPVPAGSSLVDGWLLSNHQGGVRHGNARMHYVIDLLDDATDFSWASAKASHAVLLCCMEQGEIKSWLETEKIDRFHRVHAQRHSSSQSTAQNDQDKHSSGKVTTSVYYNKGCCAQKQTHETKGVLYKHVCAKCWSEDCKSYPNPQTECRNSAKMGSPGHDPGFESCP